MLFIFVIVSDDDDLFPALLDSPLMVYFDSSDLISFPLNVHCNSNFIFILEANLIVPLQLNVMLSSLLTDVLFPGDRFNDGTFSAVFINQSV